MPLHPRERKIRLENLDQKVDIVNEIASAKPKPVKAKRNTDKMKFINEQIKAEDTENLMLGNVDFDTKLMLNKRLIFNTTIIDVEIIKDRIIDAINNSYNNKYWIEHKPGTHYFTLRLKNAG